MNGEFLAPIKNSSTTHGKTVPGSDWLAGFGQRYPVAERSRPQLFVARTSATNHLIFMRSQYKPQSPGTVFALSNTREKWDVHR